MKMNVLSATKAGFRKSSDIKPGKEVNYGSSKATADSDPLKGVDCSSMLKADQSKNRAKRG